MKREGLGRWFNKSNDNREGDEKVKPIRNIFKMSRILVDVKSKNKKDPKALNKVNEKKDSSGNEHNSETHSDGVTNTDKGSDDDYEYSESSDHSDEESVEGDGLKKKVKKPQK